MKKNVVFVTVIMLELFLGGGGPYHQVENLFGRQTVQFDPQRKDSLDKPAALVPACVTLRLLRLHCSDVLQTVATTLANEMLS